MVLETLVEQPEERVVLAGTANLTRSALDFPLTLRPVLEALEEQVVLLKLIGEANDPTTVHVKIGEENSVEGLRSTSVVTVGYGPGRARWPASASSARPAWTTPARSARCARSPATSGRSWRRADQRVATSTGDYYEMLGVAASRRPTRSRRPTASSPASCTPTSTPTRRRRSGSRT